MNSSIVGSWYLILIIYRRYLSYGYIHTGTYLVVGSSKDAEKMQSIPVCKSSMMRQMMPIQLNKISIMYVRTYDVGTITWPMEMYVHDGGDEGRREEQ